MVETAAATVTADAAAPWGSLGPTLSPAEVIAWRRRTAGHPAGETRHRLLGALIAALVTGLILQLAWPIATLLLHVSSNNNEGWNAYWTARALAGQPLYTDAASPISNNYPPLSFYLVGWFGRAIGDPIVAGRLLALGGLLACVALVAAIADRFGGERRWSLLAAGTFLLFIGCYAQRYIATDDPQWLAEAAMMAALALLIGRRPGVPASGRLVAACLLMLVGGLIKHSQIALPAAVTLWLGLVDRRALLLWLATSVAAGAVALVVLDGMFGEAFFDQVLHHQRTFQAIYFLSSMKTLAPMLPGFVVAGMLWRSRAGRSGDPRLLLLFLFAATATVAGIVERFGTAVAQNAHFDTVLAIFILSGIALGRSNGGLRSSRARLIAFALMMLPLAGKAMLHIPATAARLAALPETRAAWALAANRLRTAQGPVGCERPALCYWSGKPYALDFSNYGQKLRLGHDPIDLARAISQQRFGAFVELRDKRYLKGDGRLPNAYYALIDRHYRIAQVLPDDLYVLVPRA